MKKNRPRSLKFMLHLMLFPLAFIIFYFGLGVGLIISPLLGTLLWILAVAIGIYGAYWLTRRHEESTPQ